MNKSTQRQIRSDKKNCKRYQLKLTLSTDADLIGWLDAQPNKQGAIKQLIRNELSKQDV